MQPRFRLNPPMALCLFLASAIFAAPPAVSEPAVTTYVIRVQEQREQTRWTLTEWLRIKERMRMMDLWLAMFSDPQKDKFQPELMLSYGITNGRYSYDSGNERIEDGALTGNSAKAQLWLTNLISSSIGLRMLNVDLGGEYYRRQTDEFNSNGFAATAAANAAASTSTNLTGRQLRTQYYTGNLRIFGRNIQDSSLILKYGRYEASNDILDPIALEQTKEAATGAAAGAELQLYIFRWLGLEGSYMRYTEASASGGKTRLSGQYHDYLAYAEVSLLRLMVGAYTEAWSISRLEDSPIQTRETGTIAGLKLQL